MKKHISVTDRLFDKNFLLIDGADDIFELELALWERETLSAEELLGRGAYFKLVNGKETAHYQLCNLQKLEEVHKSSSFRTKMFFLDGKYSTGYATHSLFPYRGKFHPQLIKALLNIMNVKPGQVVLDPMSGSSTVSVEANLLGIDSVSVDLSPFCGLMGRVKTFALDLEADVLESITSDCGRLLKKLNKERVPDYFRSTQKDNLKNYYEIVLLAFLDSVGFSNRVESPIEGLFPRVLERYVSTIKFFQQARETVGLKLGSSKILQGNAMELHLPDNSVDAVITSPPYSFAIDYLKNDKPQLEYLGYSLEKLRSKMIGLQGRGINDRLEIYFNNMATTISEMIRVSKKNSKIVIIIGTNDIQTRGIRLEKKVIEIGEELGLNFELEMKKPIRGIQNTMKEESILFFSNSKKL